MWIVDVVGLWPYGNKVSDTLGTVYYNLFQNLIHFYVGVGFAIVSVLVVLMLCFICPDTG